MPKIYKRNCNNCGKPYKGQGQKYCSNFCSHQANPTPHLGHKHNDKTREKIRYAHLGRKHTEEWKKKARLWLIGNKSKTGQKASIETRLKQSFAHRKEKAYNYKGETAASKDRLRHQIEMRLWREAIFARDNWTCQKCKKRGGKLVGHHIQNYAEYPELRFAIDNGITLCRDCHISFHKKYGTRKNNKQQIDEWLK